MGSKVLDRRRERIASPHPPRLGCARRARWYAPLRPAATQDRPRRRRAAPRGRPRLRYTSLRRHQAPCLQEPPAALSALPEGGSRKTTSKRPAPARASQASANRTSTAGPPGPGRPPADAATARMTVDQHDPAAPRRGGLEAEGAAASEEVEAAGPAIARREPVKRVSRTRSVSAQSRRSEPAAAASPAPTDDPDPPWS